MMIKRRPHGTLFYVTGTRQKLPVVETIPIYLYRIDSPEACSRSHQWFSLKYNITFQCIKYGKMDYTQDFSDMA